MSTYRVYRLSPRGRIKTGHWVEAATDDEVRLKAENLCDDGCPKAEIWQGVKRVAVVGGDVRRR